MVDASRTCLLPGVRFSPAERRARLLNAYRIDLVIDVGANCGQYAAALRRAGYGGRIVSFEPLSEPCLRLVAASADDPAWDARCLALGHQPAIAQMHVSEDSRNSSLLPVGPRHVRAVPDSRSVGVETVRVERLDAIWGDVAADASCPYLKMDTQGYELEILRGATGVLDEIAFVEAEISLLAGYGPAPSFSGVVGFLAERQFAPIAFEGVLDDEDTGEMLQADAIFRSDRLPLHAAD